MNKNEAEKYCKCMQKNVCQSSCRNYIDYPQEHNCVLVTVKENSNMSLRDVADRLKISHVRVMQIEREALKKLNKKMMNE